ncbi:MAG TPA: hypothetical protein VGL19_10745 [Polyangiaceae bacterium]
MGLEQVDAEGRRAMRTALRARSAPVARHALGVLVLLAAFAVARPAAAQGDGDSDVPDPLALQTHAFVSQGFLKSNQNNYLTSSKRGSFEFTEVGINFTKALTDNFRVGVQLFTHDLGPLGNYRTQFDWYYLDYRGFDWLGLRAGRTKIPFGLYNDSSDFDSARVPVLLPQSVYPIDHRDYLLAQIGGEVYGNIRLGELGSLEYRGYGGTLDFSAPAAPAPGITVSNLSVPYVYGGRLMWSTPVPGLLAGASYQKVRFDADYNFAPALGAPLQAAGLLPANFNGTLPTKFLVKLWVASLEYQTGGLLASAEYSRWIGGFESAASPLLLPPHVVNERYYAMVSYHVAPWFTPGVYYSSYMPNRDDKSGGRASYQHDFALSFRYDINAHWLIKVEGHWMEGTAALDKTLNDNHDPSTLAKEWGLLALKTTAYF